jgi:hypothetical protein
MEYIAEVLVAIIVGWIGHRWYRHQKYRNKVDEFKEMLRADISNYESAETTLSAIVLSIYPKHNQVFQKLLLYVPKSRKQWLAGRWDVYEEIYNFFKQFGVFGVAMAELPHPDFGATPESARLVERKRKIQIAGVFNEILEKL